jgi:hypothetical protein
VNIQMSDISYSSRFTYCFHYVVIIPFIFSLELTFEEELIEGGCFCYNNLCCLVFIPLRNKKRVTNIGAHLQ